MNATVIVLIVLFSIAVVSSLAFFDDSFDRYAKKNISDYILPITLIITDTYCLIISNICEYELFERWIIIALGILSISFSVITFIVQINKSKKKYRISLLTSSIEVLSVENLFILEDTEEFENSPNSEKYPTYCVDSVNEESVIDIKIFRKKLISKKKMTKKEINFIVGQLNMFCDNLYLLDKEEIEKLKAYKVALFKIESLYDDYKDIDFKLLEKAKGK